MKRIDTRLEALEIKAAAAQIESRGYCTCTPEIIIQAPVALEELPGQDDQAAGYTPGATGICSRCGGKFGINHPPPPILILQPVKAK